MGVQIVSGGASGGSPVVTGLSAGEALAINDAVMIDAANNQVWKCTVAKGAQVIGIMKKAVLIGNAVSFSDIAFAGEIVDGIVGVAIVRGDRLVVAGATARLGPQNSTPTHTHIAYTMGASPVSFTGSAMNKITDGAGVAMVQGNRQSGTVLDVSVGAGADHLTCTTSSKGALTTGLIIAKALESNAALGTTVKVLVVSGI